MKQPVRITREYGGNRYGWAEIEPADPIIAGEVGSWTLTVVVGEHGIDDSGALAIARRDVSDWEIAQFDQPQESGYVTAETTGDAQLRLRYDQNCYVRPWRAAVIVEVYDGALAPGDKVWIVLGDTRSGAPGMRAQTFPETAYTFKVLVDAFGTGRYYEIEPSPVLTIRGGLPEQLEVVAPSTVHLQELFSLVIRALDRWGNPSPFYEETVVIQADGVQGLPIEVHFSSEDNGVLRLEGLRAGQTGQLQFLASDTEGRQAQSNALMVYGEGEFARLYWGDLHGQTGLTVGTGTIDEYLRFGRDVAALDFISWQGNDFQITSEGWEEITRYIRRYNEPGRFVTFLGYEWSGLTPAGGDHNFYFLGDSEPLHRSSHWLIEDKADEETDRYPISEVLSEWRDRKDVLAIPHVGGRYANLDFYDAHFMPVVEIHSHHGTFEWLAEEALRRGLRVGFIAGSDDHTCRPGLSYPTREASRGLASFDVKGGYAGVYAGELSREALLDAIFRRHTFATTGERIFLEVTTPEGAMMGDELQGDRAPQLNVKVSGTAPIFTIEIQRGLKTIYRWPVPDEVSTLPLNCRRLALIWRGVRVRGRKKKARWDGSLTIQDGLFREVKPFAFDHEDEGVTHLTTQSVTWRSTTSGDPDGLLIDLEGDNADLHFVTAPVSFTLSLPEIGNRVLSYAGGGVNLQVQVFWVPREGAPFDLSFSFRDPAPIQGEANPYWVRVTQYNGGVAWSSPIYFQCNMEAQS